MNNKMSNEINISENYAEDFMKLIGVSNEHIQNLKSGNYKHFVEEHTVSVFKYYVWYRNSGRNVNDVNQLFSMFKVDNK